MLSPDIKKLHSTLAPIVDRLDNFNSRNIEGFHELALSLAELGYDKYDTWQSEAMVVARTLWTPQFDEDKWSDIIQIAALKLDEFETPSLRLLWCALNRNTVLDSFGAEYLIDKAFSAGVSSCDIYAIFKAFLDNI